MAALSWKHANGASITRCSQPLVGLLWSRFVVVLLVCVDLVY